MTTNDFENIEEIKKLKENCNIGWSKHLIPFCKSYFEGDFPLSFIKKRIVELYELDISIHTLKFIRTKYKKSLNKEPPHTTLITKGIRIPQEKVITTPKGKLTQEERDAKEELLQKVFEDMTDFDNRPPARTEFDDFVEFQEKRKLAKELEINKKNLENKK